MLFGNIRCQACKIHHIHKKIVLQGFGYFHQQFHINSWTGKNFIYIGTIAMYPSCQLHHTHAAFVKNGFYKITHVKFMLCFHLPAFCHDIKKAWKKSCLILRVSTPTPSNKSIHAAIYTAFRELILEGVLKWTMWKIRVSRIASNR